MGRDVFSASHLRLDEHVQGATIRYKNETNATDMAGRLVFDCRESGRLELSRNSGEGHFCAP